MSPLQKEWEMPFYFIRSLHVELYSCTKSRGLNRLWTHLGSNYFRYHEITVIQNVAKQRQHPSGQARRSNVFLLTKVYMFPLKPILNSMWQLKVTRSKLYMDEGNRISFSSSKRPTDLNKTQSRYFHEQLFHSRKTNK
jgi:hypothetical protein